MDLNQSFYIVRQKIKQEEKNKLNLRFQKELANDSKNVLTF